MIEYKHRTRKYYRDLELKIYNMLDFDSLIIFDISPLEKIFIIRDKFKYRVISKLKKIDSFDSIIEFCGVLQEKYHNFDLLNMECRIIKKDIDDYDF